MYAMKILIVLNEAPLPFSSAASRWYYSLLSGLIQYSGIELNIVAACQNQELLDKSLELFPTGDFYLYPKRSGFKSKLQTIFMPFSYNISPAMKDKVEQLSVMADVVHVEQTFAAWACRKITKKHLVSIHYLSRIDLANSEPVNFKDWLIVKMMMFTEKRLISKFTNIKTCSSRLANFIKLNDAKTHVTYFPFSIDVNKYQYLAKENRQKKNTVTLIANMGWYPGKSAALNLLKLIWPKLKARNSELKLRIVGWNARTVLQNYLNLPDIEILENVPKIEDYFYNSDVLIYYPEKGSGIKIKIQEAMLFGVPVATNSEGAEGINILDNVHAVVEDNLESFIDKTDLLINSIELQEKYRANAYSHIATNCSNEKVITSQVDLYKQILRQIL
jgi:glycosyltransferase involved in cell wall biosynthesis